jgi:hypothetical protein
MNGSKLERRCSRRKKSLQFCVISLANSEGTFLGLQLIKSISLKDLKEKKLYQSFLMEEAN